MKKRSKEQVMMWLFEQGEIAYKNGDNTIDRVAAFMTILNEGGTRFLTEDLVQWVMQGNFENLRYRMRKAREKFLEQRARRCRTKASPNEPYHPHGKMVVEEVQAKEPESIATDHKIYSLLKNALLECIEAKRYEAAKSIIDAIRQSGI